MVENFVLRSLTLCLMAKTAHYLVDTHLLILLICDTATKEKANTLIFTEMISTHEGPAILTPKPQTPNATIPRLRVS